MNGCKSLCNSGSVSAPTENSRIDLHHDIGLVARLRRRWYAHASLVAQEDNLQSVGGGARLPAVRSKGIVVGQLDDLIAEALPQLGHVSAGGSVEARVDPLDCMLGRDFSRFRLTFRGALAANSCAMRPRNPGSELSMPTMDDEVRALVAAWPNSIPRPSSRTAFAEANSVLPRTWTWITPASATV